MKAYLFPGQGSQHKGMGAELFDQFPALVAEADEVLGYSIAKLCLGNPKRQLAQTQYTQPAIYVVSCLSYLQTIENKQTPPDFLAGHSLGEYVALFAAGVFDFITGLKLVQMRGELMSQASGGIMAAVKNISEQRVKSLLQDNGLTSIDIANYNTPSQLVLSGPKADMLKAGDLFDVVQKESYFRLNVSAPFHSRYMEPVTRDFSASLEEVEFSPPKIPVIANATARPYDVTPDAIKHNLLQQIQKTVQWTDTIRYLMGQEVTEYQEIGPGDVLTKLTASIQKQTQSVVAGKVIDQPEDTTAASGATTITSPATVANSISPESLGSDAFKKAYQVSRAYIAGAMVRGIASRASVIRMAKAGYLSFFGAGGLSLDKITANIQAIQKSLINDESWGMNLLCNHPHPEEEMVVVECYLRHGVRCIEASAYISLSPALVRYRLAGLSQDSQGKVIIKHKVLAKLSRPEVAEIFLNPAPEQIIKQLLQQDYITPEQASLAKQVPMADDICVEADSGGHTDRGISSILLPAILRLRDDIYQQQQYLQTVRVGAAGGIGTPEAAASAFMLGADFILTGSINQCSVEAGTSDTVKNLLQQVEVQDTDYAPAGDMFEVGAKVQVLKKGVLFPARANKLYELWRQHKAWHEIEEKTRHQIETKYFKRSFEQVYTDTRDYFLARSPKEIERAEQDPKHKMALVFRWYFAYSMRLADEGNESEKINYQVHCGPAMGAFNQWVKGTELEPWKNRHVDAIANHLMENTAVMLQQRITQLTFSKIE